MKPISERHTISEILELSPNPTQEEIKRNYLRLVKVYHPDRNKSPEAAEYMKKINRAYAIATGKEPIPQQPIQPQQPVIIIRWEFGSSGSTWYYASYTTTATSS